MKYFGIEFKSAANTTTGTPNKKTGRYSIACDLRVFKTKQERDEWKDYNKIACNKKTARNYFLGMSVSDFNEYVSDVIFTTDV